MKLVTLKTKKCRHCTNSFTPFNSLQVACSVECSLQLAKAKSQAKAKQESQQERKKEQAIKQLRKVEFEKQHKTLSQYEKEAKRQFQLYCRLRDHSIGCISCGTTNSQIWDGGHYMKAELYSGTIFHEFNVNKQCRKCNYFLGGNEFNYRIGLVSKIGLQEVEALEKEAQEKRFYKWTKAELIDIKELYLQKCRELKKVIEK